MFPSPIVARDEGKIYRLASGRTGSLLASIMDTIDGEIRLLDALTLARRGRLFLGAMRTARACALSHDDAALAVATHDDVSVFDLASGTVRWTVARPGDEPALAYSFDGSRLALGHDRGGITVLRVGDGSVVGSVDLTDEPRALVWDRTGLVSLTAGGLVLVDEAQPKHAQARFEGRDREGCELVAMDRGRFAVAGTGPEGVWLEVRARPDARVESSLRLPDDRRAEGLAFAGGVLFVGTEAGTYRADAPYEQLVRWLPPLGGAHDPTRLAPLADGHLAIAARDLRVFRTHS
jgi:hypothetical protein